MDLGFTLVKRRRCNHNQNYPWYVLHLVEKCASLQILHESDKADNF